MYNRKVEVFYPVWTKKSLTFSIDDGNIALDRKFLRIVNPAGLHGTFNLVTPLNSLPQCQVMNSKKGKKYPLSIKRRGDICDTNYNLFAFQRIHKIIAKRP